MVGEELFVGAVSILLGLAGLLAAIGNSDWCFELRKVQWIEHLAGRRGARWMYALLGIGLIVLGVAIALGFGPNKAPRALRCLVPGDLARRSANGDSRAGAL